MCVWVCVCVCMCACMSVWVGVCVWVCLWVCVCIGVYVCVYECMGVCVCGCVCMCACMNVWVCVFVWVCLWVCVYTCVYVSVFELMGVCGGGVSPPLPFKFLYRVGGSYENDMNIVSLEHTANMRCKFLQTVRTVKRQRKRRDKSDISFSFYLKTHTVLCGLRSYYCFWGNIEKRWNNCYLFLSTLQLTTELCGLGMSKMITYEQKMYTLPHSVRKVC